MDAPQEPISLESAKAHLRLDPGFVQDDDYVTGLIGDAREFVEAETGLVLVPRSLTETARQLGSWIDLVSWPVQAVTAIRYPLAGQMTVLPITSWLFSLKARPVRILPVAPGWGVPAISFAMPSLPIEIDLDAGYSDPTLIPRRALRAMLLLIEHWYRNRSAAEVGSRAVSVAVEFAVAELLAKLKGRTI